MGCSHSSQSAAVEPKASKKNAVPVGVGRYYVTYLIAFQSLKMIHITQITQYLLFYAKPWSID
jgi:hypothetical protein